MIKAGATGQEIADYESSQAANDLLGPQGAAWSVLNSFGLPSRGRPFTSQSQAMPARRRQPSSPPRTTNADKVDSQSAISDTDPTTTARPNILYVNRAGEGISSATLSKQGTSRLAGSFQGLAGATVDEIVSRIPSHWTSAPQRGGNGIRFFDEAGFERLRLHGPSTKAAVGSNSRSGWTLRVMDRAGNYHDNAGRLVPYRANEGHIPIYGNPNEP